MDKIKAVFITFFTAVAARIGVLVIPMLILILMNFVDYGTGLMASKYRKEKVSSYKSIRGIIKKVCMWLLVGIGAVMDWLMLYASRTVNLEVPVTFLIASLVAVWLICNEMISILENIADIGVSLPPFLSKLVDKVKSQAEDKGSNF